MKRNCVLFFAVLCLATIAVGAAPRVFAQEDDSDQFTLEEITVTAQKRAENQQKVPIAMEVISAEDLRMSGKNDLSETGPVWWTNSNGRANRWCHTYRSWASPRNGKFRTCSPQMPFDRIS